MPDSTSTLVVDRQATLSELRAIYTDLADAFRRKDLNAVAGFIAPEFRGQAGKQTVSRDDLLGHVRDQFAKWEDITWNRELSDLRVEGDAVTVRASGVYLAKDRNTGEPV